MVLPYMVVADGRTVADHVLPQLERSLIGKPSLMLPPAPHGEE